MLPYIIAYLVIINVVGFLIMLIDKQKAKKRKRRIPEAALITVAAIGGSIGVLAAMDIFRHKTRYREFTVGVPLILVVQAVLAYLAFWYL